MTILGMTSHAVYLEAQITAIVDTLDPWSAYVAGAIAYMLRVEDESYFVTLAAAAGRPAVQGEDPLVGRYRELDEVEQEKVAEASRLLLLLIREVRGENATRSA